jgi:hypothetical protein
MSNRVARWYIYLLTKNPNFGIPILEGVVVRSFHFMVFDIFYGHFVYFKAIWCILWLFGSHLPVLVCCTKKNLATLISNRVEIVSG